MASYFNYTIKEFLIESWDGTSSLNLASCISSIQYFEDVFSPAIFISILLVNTDGLLTSFQNDDPSMKSGIKGGERVRLVIEQTATKKTITLDETKNPYYIYKIHSSTSEATREFLSIELAPAEVFTNETSRVFNRYPEKEGNVESINSSVNSILKNVLKTNKNIDAESTLNSYSFFGNSKKPFTILTWLCPKAIPNIGKSGPEAGTAGFLFYENKNGYNFKSVDNLLSGLTPNTADSKNIIKYSLTNSVDKEADFASNFRIISMPVFEKNVNIFENLRIGMYSSVNYFFDINTRKLNVYNYKLTESYNTMKHSSSSTEKPKVPKGLENSPSRLMVKVTDSLVMNTLNGNPNKTPDNRIKYQSQSVARYNLAFTQLLNITIPLNLDLTVGDVIELNFGKIAKDDSRGTRDDLKSGYYLIKELSHLFSEQQGYTGLKLVRDSYGKP
jgi:hypothetical protein